MKLRAFNPRVPLFCLLLLAQVVLPVANHVAYAQSLANDYELPVIGAVTLQASSADTITLSVDATDNDQLVVLELFYKFSGDQRYKRLDLLQGNQAPTYTAAFGNTAIGSPVVRYYIVAEDFAGNLSQRGSLESPQVWMGDATPIFAENTPSVSQADEPQIESSTKFPKAMYYLLGVLAVGALAGLAGGGGGGSSGSPGCSDTGCLLTIQTGAP